MQSKFNGVYTIVHRPEGKVMLVKATNLYELIRRMRRSINGLL